MDSFGVGLVDPTKPLFLVAGTASSPPRKEWKKVMLWGVPCWKVQIKHNSSLEEAFMKMFDIVLLVALISAATALFFLIRYLGRTAQKSEVEQAEIMATGHLCSEPSPEPEPEKKPEPEKNKSLAGQLVWQAVFAQVAASVTVAGIHRRKKGYRRAK
jgi:hypothetical protein